MGRAVRYFSAAGLAGLVVCFFWGQHPSVALAQSRKPVVMTRLYTGADGQTHAQDVQIAFRGDPQSEVSEMSKVEGVEIHRYAPGYVNDWHTASRRQLVITLSGKGEIEVAGGKKIPVGPGHVLIVEDVTGKGHITRVVGTEDRVTMQIPLTGSFPVASLK
jgi:hypothetical protein